MRERGAPEQAEHDVAAPAVEQVLAPELAQAQSLQRAIGNRAFGRLLARDAVDTAVPAGVTAGANALPAEAPRTADKVTTVPAPDASLGSYQWVDKTQTTDSGTVGAMDRILLDGLVGSQSEQGALPGVTPPTGSGYANAVGQGAAGARGRAVAIVPRALRKAPAGEVAVVVHFHGIKGGSWEMRARSGSPEDVGSFQIPSRSRSSSPSGPARA